jgi:hypothetical protein
LGIHVNAQAFLRDTLLVKDSGFFARVEIETPAQKKNLSTVVFITVKEDNKVKNLAQQSFDSFSVSGKAAFNKVKVVFFPENDSLTSTVFQHLSKSFTGKIMSEITRKFSAVSKSRLIISGINDGAIIALYTAASLPESINKTGIFIDSFPDFFKMKKELLPFASKIKGKIFINTQNEFEENFATDFADAVALNTGVMIYKIDDFKAGQNENIFSIFYSWAIADGNNHIIDIK